MELKIYNQSGVLKLTVSTAASSTLNQELMTEHAVSASFTHPFYVPLDVNDYVMLEGVKFSVKKEYKPKQKNLQTYDYSVKFYAPIHDAQQVMYLHLTDGQYNPQFSLDGGPREHLLKWVENMNRIYGREVWSIGDVVVAGNQTIEYNNVTCWDAIASISETFETEWWADGFTVNLGRCEQGKLISLGYLQGLTSLTQSENSSDVKFFTRLIPLGSTKNIDRTRYGYTRLQLPDKAVYVDRNTHYGLYEHVEESAFAEIFPHYTGTVTAVRQEEQTGEDKKPFTVYYFKDSGMTFDPSSKENEIGGLVKHVSFQTGDLAGRDFEANYKSETKEWEIINTYPSDDVQIPGGNLIPAIGNTYIPWNFKMPVEYEVQAEKDYKAAVDDFLAKYSEDISKYGGDTDYTYIDAQSIPLSLGQRVRLLSDKYFATSDGYRDTRLTKVVRKLDNLSVASIECTNQVGKGWKSQVDSSLAQLKYVVAQQQEETVLDILKSWDGREATDYRVMSALRVLKEIKDRALSSLEPDTAQDIITFLKGLISQGLIKALAGLEVGENGSGISVLPDGKTQAVVDYLYVKVKAIFDELEVKKKTYVGGEQVLSPAGMKCIRVEELTDSYRCFFKAEEDGVEIENQFTPGTLAIAQECNIKVGVSHHAGNRYYWREVTAVGTDYIELSKTKCDPNVENDIPAAGDDIVALGHDTDITRQGAIVLSSVNEVAPSIIMYQGIDSFSLVDKEVIGFDFSKATGRARMRVYGDAYIGAKDRSSYIEYTQDGLEVKAKKIVLGTGDTLDETLSDLNQSVSDINNQLDQSFQIWQGETADTPTLTNKPASDWKTDADKSLHVDDFYITTEGLCYQFDLAGSVYQWKPVTDKYLIAYVQQIGEKKRVFVNRPADAVSYDVGDCWVNANYTDGSGKVLYNNDRLVCVTAKAAGTAFSISHWKKDSKYTDDTKAEEAFDYTDKKVLELQAYADKSAQAKADAAAVLAKGYADGIVTKSEANAIDAANRYAELQDELLKIATDAYADGVVSEEEKRAIADAQAKADAAQKAAQDYADKMDAETETKLLKTGIDIGNNTITATADKFTVQGRDGKIYAVFEVDSDTGLPMMKADYIKVTSLLVENAIEAGGLNIDDKFVVTVGSDGKATVRLVGEIDADTGQIAGFKISGTSLTNAGFDNDAAVVFRNDKDGKFSGIGGNLLPSELGGISAVARFENNKVAPDVYAPENIAIYANAEGSGNDNIALLVRKGRVDIPGLLLGARISVIDNQITLDYQYGRWKPGWVISYSDGSFLITHNLGHSNYFVNANTNGDTDSFCAVHSISSNSFRITVYSSAGNRRNDNGFMFSVMGDKY